MQQPEPVTVPACAGEEEAGHFLRTVGVRAAIDSCPASRKIQEPTVWLPWCMAPLWVCLPILGCVVASLFRQPVAAESRQPAAAMIPEAQDSALGLEPLVPLVTTHLR